MQKRGAFVAGVAGSFVATRTRAAEPIGLQLGAMPIDPSAEAFYGQDRGFFRSAGLDVKVTVLNNGSALAAATTAGTLDVGFGSPSPVILAHSRGLPVRFIAPAAVYTGPVPNSSLMVAKGAAIRSGADLNGKTVAVAGLHDLTQYSTQAWIDKNGGDSKTVAFIEVPYAEMAVALQQGRIAAGCDIEPYTTGARGVAQTLGNLNDAIARRYLLAGWFATDGWLQRNGDAAAKFVAAMHAIARWANAHPRESAPILSRYTKIPPEVATTMARSRYDESPRVEPAVLQPVIDVMVKYGSLAPVAATDLIWKGTP
jgi:NitT/TauT family transport system substrate-binding protein